MNSACEMSAEARRLLEASQLLTVADRLALADAIWETIPIDEDWRPSEAVLAELDRRMAEHGRDPGSAIEWPEMQRRLEELKAKFR